jgi:hypothetical protein
MMRASRSRVIEIKELIDEALTRLALAHHTIQDETAGELGDADKQVAKALGPVGDASLTLEAYIRNTAP